MYTQVLTQFFSASDIMEAVRGRFRFYGTNAVLPGLLKLKTCSLYHENL